MMKEKEAAMVPSTVILLADKKVQLENLANRVPESQRLEY